MSIYLKSHFKTKFQRLATKAQSSLNLETTQPDNSSTAYFCFFLSKYYSKIIIIQKTCHLAQNTFIHNTNLNYIDFMAVKLFEFLRLEVTHRLRITFINVVF